MSENDDNLNDTSFDDAFEEFSGETGGNAEPENDAGAGSDESATGNDEQDESTGNDWEAERNDLLAKLQAYEHEAKSSNGRVSALQKKLNDYEAILSERDNPTKPEDSDEEQAWARYAEDFPEEAKAIQAYVNKHLKATTEQVQNAITPIQQQAQERYREQQALILTGMIPDWRETVNSTVFDKWLKEQPEEVQRLYYTDEAAKYAKLLGYFQRDQDSTQSSASQAKADELAKARQNKLAANVALPRGKTVKPQGVPDDFDSAFDYFAKNA